jgi:hypothetical protein
MRRFEVLRQGFELQFPKRAVSLDPCGGVFHRLRGEPTTVDAAVDFTLEQTRGFQDAQVFRDRRQGNIKRLGEFGDHGLALSEPGQDGAAGGIGQRTEGGVQGCGRIVNHSV